jgi:hypothetical protein
MLLGVILEVQSLLREWPAYQLYLQEVLVHVPIAFFFFVFVVCVRLFVGVIVVRVWVNLVLP